MSETENIQRYPLQWPAGWRRSKYTQHSRFSNNTLAKSRDALLHELELLGATQIVVSTNLVVRKSDGLPKDGQRQPVDRGIAIYFKLKGKSQCIPCDKWNCIEDNLWAIKKTVEALRGLERWGAKEMVDAAFTGFKALPTGTNPWWEVLGCQPDSPIASIEEKYKNLAFLNHPDRGGCQEKMVSLNIAFQEAKRIYAC